jgi:hypothetical protein
MFVAERVRRRQVPLCDDADVGARDQQRSVSLAKGDLVAADAVVNRLGMRGWPGLVFCRPLHYGRSAEWASGPARRCDKRRGGYQDEGPPPRTCRASRN